MPKESDRIPITIKNRIVGTAVIHDDDTVHGIIFEKSDYDHLLDHNVPWQFNTLELREISTMEVEQDEKVHNVFDENDSKGFNNEY